MNNKELFTRTLSSLSLLALAAALAYFSFSLIHLVNRLPEVSASVDTLSQSISPVLAESQEIRALIPGIVEEVQLIRAEISPIVTEVKAARLLVPDIVSAADDISVQIPAIIEESKGYRQLIPTVVSESEQLRKSIPLALAHADSIVAESKQIASTAGESAVTGVFTGLFKAPVNLVTGVSDKLWGRHSKLSATEKTLIESTLLKVVNSDKIGETKSFSHSKTSMQGNITLDSSYTKNNASCRSLTISLSKRNKEFPDNIVRVCRNNQGNWSIDND